MAAVGSESRERAAEPDPKMGATKTAFGAAVPAWRGPQTPGLRPRHASSRRLLQVRPSIQASDPRTDEQDSGVKLVLPKYEFTKVFVGGHEQGTRLATLQENRIIVDSGMDFSNKQDIMSIRTVPVNNLLIDVFVRDNLHSRAFSVG
jgi:hypothetical protein